MSRPKIYTYSFANIYPLYLEKISKKGRSQAELNEVIYWLTGYDQAGMQAQIDSGADLEAFFANAPKLNPNAPLITGVVCGVRVEAIEDETTQKIRYLDKLVDELAKGKALGKIMRG